MLNARDKEAVLAWSERQLGEAAKRAAVVELNHETASDWVEKSGTGVQPSGCEAFFSVMADSIQRVAGSEASEFSCLDRSQAHELRSRKSTVH